MKVKLEIWSITIVKKQSHSEAYPETIFAKCSILDGTKYSRIDQVKFVEGSF